MTATPPPGRDREAVAQKGDLLMGTLHIHDGMAVLRRIIEKDPLGRGPRSVITNMLNAPAGDVNIWCFEGAGSKAARRAFYPGYKDRPKLPLDGFYALVEVIREGLSHTAALQLHVPGYEADDCIAHVCESYAGQMPIHVQTVDRDLLALEVNKGVKVHVTPMKIGEHIVEPKDLRLYKTYCGDSSDTIPGLPGFGPKSWLACRPDALMFAHRRLLDGRQRATDFIEAGVIPTKAEAICTPSQAEMLRAFWKIIGFMPLPTTWEEHIKPGTKNEAKALDLLAKHRH